MHHRHMKPLPSRKRLVANEETARQILATTRQREQDVMIRPVLEPGRQSKLWKTPGKMTTEKTRRPVVHKLDRQALLDFSSGHDHTLSARHRQQLTVRPGLTAFGDPNQREPRGLHSNPRPHKAIPGGAGAADPQDLWPLCPDPTHQRGRRYAQLVLKACRRQHSPEQQA